MRPLASSALVSIALSASSLVASVACNPPAPPTLTPQSATVTDVSLTGVNVDLKLTAANSNGFALTAQKVVGTVTIFGKPLGAVTVPESISIPANGSSTIDATLAAQWIDLVSVAQSASLSAPVPFTVDGTVTFGGDKLNVDLPFHTSGSIAPADIRKAAAGALAPELQKLMQKGGAAQALPLALPTTPRR